MFKLNWSKEMAFGIGELDDYRVSLLNIINHLHDALEQEKPVAQIAAMLQRFSVMSREYLALEKRYITVYEPYDKARELRNEATAEMNRALITGLARYTKGYSPLDSELLGQIAAWLQNHFIETAKIAQGVSAPAPAEKKRT